MNMPQIASSTRSIFLASLAVVSLGLSACSRDVGEQPLLVPSERQSSFNSEAVKVDLLTASSACAATMLNAYVTGVKSLTVDPSDSDQSGPLIHPEQHPVAAVSCDQQASPTQVLSGLHADRV